MRPKDRDLLLYGNSFEKRMSYEEIHIPAENVTVTGRDDMDFKERVTQLICTDPDIVEIVIKLFGKESHFSRDEWNNLLGASLSQHGHGLTLNDCESLPEGSFSRALSRFASKSTTRIDDCTYAPIIEGKFDPETDTYRLSPDAWREVTRLHNDLAICKQERGTVQSLLDESYNEVLKLNTALDNQDHDHCRIKYNRLAAERDEAVRKLHLIRCEEQDKARADRELLQNELDRLRRAHRIETAPAALPRVGLPRWPY